MLVALRFGLFFPRVYLFLISSGGFALLFSYTVIVATHVRFRRQNGCPPNGKCQMWASLHLVFRSDFAYRRDDKHDLRKRPALGAYRGHSLVVLLFRMLRRDTLFQSEKALGQGDAPERINTGLTEFRRNLATLILMRTGKTDI
jgi:hypothetical protein